MFASLAYFMLMIELPTATSPLPVAAAYAEADVTIRIRSNRYYWAEYRIVIHHTIWPPSKYEVNIRYSNSFNHRDRVHLRSSQQSAKFLLIFYQDLFTLILIV